MSSNEFEHYQRLLADIATLTSALSARFAREITCHLGCTGCCQQHLTLSPVEADFVHAAVRALPAEVKARVGAAARALIAGSAASTTCPLLDGPGCAIYEARPTICRTHGYPIIFKDEPSGDTCLDVCPLNFAGEGELVQLRARDSVDIDRVNLRLAAVNYAYCRDHKGDATAAYERVSMADIVISATVE